MGTVKDALRTAGIQLSALESPDVRAGLSRLTRLLRERQVRTVGLSPVADDVAVPALAVGLALSLADASPDAIGLVDACGTWACAGALGRSGRERADRPAATNWLDERVAFLEPPSARPGHLASQLRDIAQDAAAAFGHLVFDLTGMDHLGEEVAAIQFLDASILVARSGRTTARQIELRLRDIPRERFLGVLLTGT
jgi:hypothetical protein